MALISTNHRMLYVIGSSGGSFTGVITNETLTGNGTSAYPLGVSESALAPSEAEIYVQTNSGGLNEVSSVVQSNSAQWSQGGVVSGDYVPLSAIQCAIGSNNYAGYNSLVQGNSNSAYDSSIAQGFFNSANNGSLSQGVKNSADGYSLSQGDYNIATNRSIALGESNSADGHSFAQGYVNNAISVSFAQGNSNYANTESLAQGTENNITLFSLGQGQRNSAYNWSLVQGENNSAYNASIAQGLANTAYHYSLAQGLHTSADNEGLAQGISSYASTYSLAQGFTNSAITNSFAQGYGNIAQNNGFAQGLGNSVIDGFAQGEYNSAVNGQALGVGLNISHGMAVGQYNITDNAAFVIGNGTSTANRSDLFVIYPDGSVSAQGKISANGVELGAGGGGSTIDDEVVNYVVSNSANIQAANASAVNVYNTVNTNSASWAAGASTPLSSLIEYGDNVNFTALSSQIAQGIYPSIRFKLLNWVNNIAYYFCYEAKLNPVYNVSDPYGKQIDYITWIANIYARPDNAHFNSDTSSSPRFMTFNFGYDPYSREWTSAGYSAFSNM